MSTNKKREGINRFACDVSLYDTEKPKASMKYHKPPLPIILFGIVAYGFVGQPFLKQLYTVLLPLQHKDICPDKLQVQWVPVVALDLYV